MSDVWRGNRPTREPADAPERTPLWEQASVYMEEVRSALIPLRGVLEQYERKVAALEQERDAQDKQCEMVHSDLAAEIRDLRAAIREWESGATVACNLLSSPSGAERRNEVVTHLNRTHAKARALTEGEPDAVVR